MYVLPVGNLEDCPYISPAGGAPKTDLADNKMAFIKSYLLS